MTTESGLPVARTLARPTASAGHLPMRFSRRSLTCTSSEYTPMLKVFRKSCCPPLSLLDRFSVLEPLSVLEPPSVPDRASSSGFTPEPSGHAARPTSAVTASPAAIARATSSIVWLPRSAAKWLKVPPGKTARGTWWRAAVSLAAFTVPSPPHTPSAPPAATALEAASSSSSTRSSPGSKTVIAAWGSSVRSVSAVSLDQATPDDGLTTRWSPLPSSSAGAGLRGREAAAADSGFTGHHRQVSSAAPTPAISPAATRPR